MFICCVVSWRMFLVSWFWLVGLMLIVLLGCVFC